MLVVIVITAIITTVLSLAIPAIARLLKRLPIYVWRLFKACRKRYLDWRYWIRFGAQCELVSFGDLRVEPPDQTHIYTFKMHLVLKFRNRDDVNPMFVEFKDLQFRTNSEVVNNRRLTYFLNIIPEDVSFQLPPNDKFVHKHFAVCGWSNIRPRLGKTASCRMTTPGRISVGRVTRSIKIKTLTAKVDCSKIE